MVCTLVAGVPRATEEDDLLRAQQHWLGSRKMTRRPPTKAALFRRSQRSREQFFYLRQLQWVRHIAVRASELSPSTFNKQELHGFAALQAKGRRGVFGHGAHAETGASLSLTVTIYCHRHGDDIPHVGIVSHPKQATVKIKLATEFGNRPVPKISSDWTEELGPGSPPGDVANSPKMISRRLWDTTRPG
jgi:hypothetical protein